MNFSYFVGLFAAHTHKILKCAVRVWAREREKQACTASKRKRDNGEKKVEPNRNGFNLERDTEKTLNTEQFFILRICGAYWLSLQLTNTNFTSDMDIYFPCGFFLRELSNVA